LRAKPECASLYRHFRNTDELGLELVEEMGVTLCRLLRARRVRRCGRGRPGTPLGSGYHQYVIENRLLFLFVSSERSGGSRILRMAIRNEVSHFTRNGPGTSAPGYI
jgi:AcrR family transcriptional regulator